MSWEWWERGLKLRDWDRNEIEHWAECCSCNVNQIAKLKVGCCECEKFKVEVETGSLEQDWDACDYNDRIWYFSIWETSLSRLSSSSWHGFKAACSDVEHRYLG